MKRWLWRTRFRPMTIDEAVDLFGQAQFLKTMTRFGWFTAYGQGYDKRKVDCIAGKDIARIEVQLKSRNIDEGKGCWDYELSERGDPLDKNFYGQPGNFLCLIGFDRITKHGDEFIPAEYIQIALISAKKVRKNRYVLYKKKLIEGNYQGLNDYFGLANIREILDEEKRRQLFHA